MCSMNLKASFRSQHSACNNACEKNRSLQAWSPGYHIVLKYYTTYASDRDVGWCPVPGWQAGMPIGMQAGRQAGGQAGRQAGRQANSHVN